MAFGGLAATMLVELSIRDFAIIDRLRLVFGPGFNALTGETGAGKSIIIDALGAILGERTGAEFVRAGAPSARVEGVFELGAANAADIHALLAEYGLVDDDGADDEPLILAREIAAGGRSTARVNGRTVTAGTLAKLGERLVDIHGQSDHLTLLRPANHIDLLDRYAGLTAERESLSAVVADLRAVRERLASLDRDERELARRIDLLRFQVEEIAAARLRPDEEDELLHERRILGSAERLTELADVAYRKLNGAAGDDFAGGKAPRAALDLLRQVNVALAELARLDPSLDETRAQVEEQVYLLEDAAATLRDYRERVEADPARLVEIEERLTLLKDLKRKYGATLPEVIAFGEQAEAELAQIERREERAEELRERETTLLAEVGRRAAALTTQRRAAGERLSAAVESAIAELNMGRARFAVQITHADDPQGAPVRDEQGTEHHLAFDTHGVDRVEFLLAANVGEPLKPLARVASGGETARLMLALKSILSEVDTTPTLVFDEVDVGVGGRSGQVVGEKLWGLSAGPNGHQVLCISHLPQIAAFADSHFKISKQEIGERTVSSVAQITADERVDEIAAMLDGVPIAPAARANAQEMLDRVVTWKTGHQAAPTKAPARRERARAAARV
ncbi:MAG TPA: DNA repair protein RecN [Thermomicrobiales bacterium]|nr:DNA repair protein RecN [Thermomicrobiales bacterium]